VNFRYKTEIQRLFR